MVAQGEGMIVHEAQDIGDVLAFRDGASGVSLQEVTAADGSGIGCVRAVDGIAQACHLGIAVDTAVGIVLVEDHNTFLCQHDLAAHQQGHHTQKEFLFHNHEDVSRHYL